MLVPDYYFDTVYDIPLALLKKEQVKCLLLDIDNTLVPYDAPEPTAENRKWFALLAENGIRVVFVSNNKPDRVTLYAASLGFPYVFEAGKPLTKKIRTLLKAQGIDTNDCLAVGDQIFTDVLAASNLGIKCILVCSIKDVQTAFFKFKRFFEKPFVRIGKQRMKHFSVPEASDNARSSDN